MSREITEVPAGTWNRRGFRKSSYSQSEAACVEVADWDTAGAIRDTKHRDLGALVFPSPEWRAFLAAVKDGEI
ncbi:DUF397 domain-containing protein [Streptomonospora sp. PA3]|uniref:DUF397 domain-containing protein n=1 Tax=Streptomonospora sp. PA3 TaxID=2607326 RepID=UPI0012DFA109|nr:DUF397 domain-containing protein [Streptomonospora sp. PA3]MUL42635.1 DUF397 domain-containing protein [Streptomonospora sp. PA3]